MIASYTLRWVVTIFIGLVFAASGAAKLLGDPVFTAWFSEFGIPSHYMRALGVVELVGALTLAVPSLARLATTALLSLAVVASAVHLVLGQPVDALLPTLLASVAAMLVWQTRPEPKPKLLSEPELDGRFGASEIAEARRRAI